MPSILEDKTLYGRKFSYASLLWFLLAATAAVIQLAKKPGGSINNYLIFKAVFWHTIHQVNLYAFYPAEYGDINHYGPFFSLIIAPFALLPNVIGCFLWCMANAAFLFYAVRKLPVSYRNQNLILFIGLLEMMTSMHNVQFNPMLTSWVLFSYVLVHKEKDFWAVLFIAAGIYTKLYGIVGLAFFFFSKHKLTFALSFLFWMSVLFCLPMIISSPSFIIQSYKDWYIALVEKNKENIDSPMQGMTVMRILKQVCGIRNLPDLYVLATAAIFYLLPFTRLKQFASKHFQLNYLAFLLIGIVIYSSSAESATFTIAMTGVGIWFVSSDRKNKLNIALLIFAIILTSLSTTDFFPKFIKQEYVRPMGLKALPCFLIWILLAYKLLMKNFAFKKPIA
jgi:hypothetical protein